MESANIQLVKDAYAAFLRGDVPAIVAVVDEQVEWQGVIGAEGVMKSAGLRKGKGAIPGFFADVASTVEFEAFEPREFVAQGNQVVAIGRYSGRSAQTRRPFSMEWVMIFTIEHGKVTRFREFTDSAQLVRTFAA